VWVTGGIALAIMMLRGARDVRRGLAAFCAAGLLLLVALSLIGGISGRLSVVSEALRRDAGYRVSETSVGWNVFASHPLFGAGLGQSTFHVYLQGFTVTDVGPVYHSFYIAILANVGLIGLAAVLGPIAIIVGPLVRRRRPRIDGIPLAFAALACGFLVSAAAESPTDGHWELGLLPALTLLTLPARTVANRSNRSKAPLLVGAHQ
jgi:O-antigen ligase